MVEEKIKICDVCKNDNDITISRAITNCRICNKDLCGECSKLIIISICNKGTQFQMCPACQSKCKKGLEKGEFFTQEEKDKKGTIYDEATTITSPIANPQPLHPYLVQDYHQLKRQKQRGIYTSSNGKFTYTRANK